MALCYLLLTSLLLVAPHASMINDIYQKPMAAPVVRASEDTCEIFPVTQPKAWGSCDTSTCSAELIRSCEDLRAACYKPGYVEISMKPHHILKCEVCQRYCSSYAWKLSTDLSSQKDALDKAESCRQKTAKMMVRMCDAAMNECNIRWQLYGDATDYFGYRALNKPDFSSKDYVERFKKACQKSGSICTRVAVALKKADKWKDHVLHQIDRSAELSKNICNKGCTIVGTRKTSTNTISTNKIATKKIANKKIATEKIVIDMRRKDS